MKIAFVWWWDQAEWAYPNWRDGLRAAVEEIGKTNDVTWYIGKKLPDPNIDWDFILFWDDSNSVFFEHLNDYKCRKGICLTTDPYNMDNIRKLDVVFCESDPIYNVLRSQGVRVTKAFGTDTDFFNRIVWTEKDIEFFYPATFSPWKRQSDIAGLGEKLWCVGTVQPDGQFELESCKKNGVHIEEGYFPAEKIRDYYCRAKNVIIPAIHGSERTVLEAMSCEVWPIVLNENNIRARSYGEEYLFAKESNKNLNLRQFILDNYSHVKYAQQLLKGIKE